MPGAIWAEWQIMRTYWRKGGCEGRTRREGAGTCPTLGAIRQEQAIERSLPNQERVEQNRTHGRSRLSKSAVKAAVPIASSTATPNCHCSQSPDHLTRYQRACLNPVPTAGSVRWVCYKFHLHSVSSKPHLEFLCSGNGGRASGIPPGESDNISKRHNLAETSLSWQSWDHWNHGSENGFYMMSLNALLLPNRPSQAQPPKVGG